MTLNIDRLEMYKLAAKRAKEEGHELTKDRIWDQYIAISFRHGVKYLVKPHNDKPYFDELKRLGLMK